MARLNRFSFSFVRRPAPKYGPTSSDKWNDSFSELANDLASITAEWNSKLLTLTNGLPYGNLDTNVDAFTNGLDGRNMWVDGSASSTSEDQTFYYSSKNRPFTVKEQFQEVYDSIDTRIEAVQDQINTSTSGLTEAQKTRIGSNIFNTSSTSSSTSLDGRSSNNRLNIIQLATDLYGSTASLDNDGLANLTNANIYQMLSDLLSIHNSSWNSGTAPSHTGAITVTQTDVNASSPGNDSFTGTPVNLKEDLDELRNRIKTYAGTSSYKTSTTPLYSGGADSLEDLLTSTQGTGTKTSSNPWGYNYSDIDGLTTRLNAIQSFTGQDSLTDTTPDYASTNYIGINDSLEIAIGKLDSNLATFSGFSNPQLDALRAFVGQDNSTDDSPIYSGTYINDGDSLELAISKLDDEVLSQDGRLTTVEGDIDTLLLTDLVGTPGSLSGFQHRVLAVDSGETSLSFPPELEVHSGQIVLKGDVLVNQEDDGQSIDHKSLTELVTVGTGGFTDSTIQIPADTQVTAVSVRVTVQPTGTSTLDIGVSGATSRYASGMSSTAGTTAKGLIDGVRYYSAATSIRISPNVSPSDSAGRVRVTIHYTDVTPPTS